jgi:hypothetical protein
LVTSQDRRSQTSLGHEGNLAEEREVLALISNQKSVLKYTSAQSLKDTAATDRFSVPQTLVAVTRQRRQRRAWLKVFP